MKKSTSDLIFTLILIIVFISFELITDPEFNLYETTLSFLPIVLVSFISLNTEIAIKWLSPILFIVFFLSFGFGDDMVDWTSYLLTGIISFVFTIIYSLITKSYRNKKKDDPLQGSILQWLLTKYPNLSLKWLFLIDTLITTVIIASIFMFINFNFSYLIILISFVICAYFSASSIYYYVFLPKQKKES